MVEGEEEPGSSPAGFFQVLHEDGSVIFSSQQAGAFPDPEAIVALLRAGGIPAAAPGGGAGCA